MITFLDIFGITHRIEERYWSESAVLTRVIRACSGAWESVVNTRLNAHGRNVDCMACIATKCST